MAAGEGEGRGYVERHANVMLRLLFFPHTLGASVVSDPREGVL